MGGRFIFVLVLGLIGIVVAPIMRSASCAVFGDVSAIDETEVSGCEVVRFAYLVVFGVVVDVHAILLELVADEGRSLLEL